MAASLDDSGFWLPTHFLPEDEKPKPMESFDFDAGLCFPTEFPYEIDSPVESVVSSTETDSSDEEDLLAGLTRRFAQSSLQDAQRLAVPCFASEKPEKQWVSSGSPQSTLSGIGSWSGRSAVSSNGSPNGTSQVSSPPATPFGVSNDTWELIYAAAGEVARLKMSGEAAKFSNQQGRGLLGIPRSSHSNSFYSNQSLSHPFPPENQFQQFAKQGPAVKQQCPSVWARPVKAAWPAHHDHRHHHQQQQQVHILNRSRNVGHENRVCARPLDLPHSAWPPLQGQHQHQHSQLQTQLNGSGMRAVFLGGAVGKRESTGTGVFLPRRYTNPPEYRKKPGCSPVLVPAKVVQALNLNFNDMSGHAQPRAGGGVAPDHEALMARRNALLAQQRRSSVVRAAQGAALEVRLPQEWTY